LYLFNRPIFLELLHVRPDFHGQTLWHCCHVFCSPDTVPLAHPIASEHCYNILMSWLVVYFYHFDVDCWCIISVVVFFLFCLCSQFIVASTSHPATIFIAYFLTVKKAKHVCSCTLELEQSFCTLCRLDACSKMRVWRSGNVWILYDDNNDDGDELLFSSWYILFVATSFIVELIN